LGVKGGIPKVPVGRGGRSDGVAMGVASYVAVTDGCELGFLKHISISDHDAYEHVRRAAYGNESFRAGLYLLAMNVPITEPSTATIKASTTSVIQIAQYGTIPHSLLLIHTCHAFGGFSFSDTRAAAVLIS